MIDKELCDEADLAAARMMLTNSELKACGDDPPSYDKYNVGMAHVEALRKYADALEAYMQAFFKEFL